LQASVFLVLVGDSVAPLRLRLPFWHREVEGSLGISSVLCIGRSMLWGFAVWRVAAVMSLVWCPVLQPLLDGVSRGGIEELSEGVSFWICRSGESWCSWRGRWCEGDGQLWEFLSHAFFFVFVELLLALRWKCWGCGGVGSALVGGRCCCLYRSLFLVDLQLFPLLGKLMQVEVLVLASELVLTTEVDQGVAPADAPSASFRSQRPRRVATAATSKRLGPPKVQSGDLAAAKGCFISPSGEGEASVVAVANLVLLRGARGLGCVSFFFRVLSVIWGQLPQIWLFRAMSCFLN
jgi:hypothetical protein